MKSQKFIQNFKCDCYQPENYCSCANKIIGSDTLIESVNDVAAAVIEVMNLCGIHLDRAKASRAVIIYYLLQFEEIRHRIDSIPRKRLAKEGLINDLGRKCSMSRMETQMTYSIIKRVFKAFYYGSDEGGVPNPLLSRHLTHSPECLWVHAAQRTAQIYAAYEGIFYACQKDFECKIKFIYKQLYDRIANRTLADANYECVCMKCFKRITAETLRTAKVTTQMHGREDPYEAMYLKDLPAATEMPANINDQSEVIDVKESNSEFQKAPEDFHCSCPPLKLSEQDYAYRKFAESVKSDSSQGPFNCRWLTVSKEQYEADDAEPDIKLPEEVDCSPCYYFDSECEPECQCSCEECKCQTDDNYFCSHTDAIFENDFTQMEMEVELDYDEDVEDTSSKISNKIQNTPARTIITSAKCFAKEPKRYISKCSTRVQNVSKQTENDDALLQETAGKSPEQQQLYNSDNATSENSNEKNIKYDINVMEDNYIVDDVLSLIWS